MKRITETGQMTLKIHSNLSPVRFSTASVINSKKVKRTLKKRPTGELTHLVVPLVAV
jgi:hypothetical protein